MSPLRRRLPPALLLALFLPLLASPLPAAPEIPTEDLWYVVEMLGQRAGYMHVQSGPTVFAGQPAVESRVRLYNAISRMNGGIRETVVIASRSRWVEDPEGGTLYVEQHLEQGGGAASWTRLAVRGDKAFLTVSTGEDGERRAEIPWDESIAGQRTLEREVDRLLAGKAREVTVQSFSLEAGGRVLEVTLRLLERREDGTTVIEQELGELGIKTREEYRADGTMVRQEVGPVALRLADRQEALAPLEESLAAFEQVSVHLDRPLEQPRQLRRAAYRLVPRAGGEGLKLAGLFVQDQRQRIERRGEMEVLRVEVPETSEPPDQEEIEPQEYLGGSSLIESDDPAILTLARSLVAGEEPTPPGEQARRLESWVRQNVHYSGAGVGLATARQTLDSREGDCTENAFLLTALLRAIGIPARVVVGLVYTGIPRKTEGGKKGEADAAPLPTLVPHAWVEAHVEGGWRAYDSAVYSAPVDATHLAMAKSAGQEEGALLEVTVPLLAGLGRFDLAWVEITPPAAGR
jgi:transglutaminase-like putative cysteine protease